MKRFRKKSLEKINGTLEELISRDSTLSVEITIEAFAWRRAHSLVSRTTEANLAGSSSGKKQMEFFPDIEFEARMCVSTTSQIWLESEISCQRSVDITLLAWTGSLYAAR